MPSTIIITAADGGYFELLRGLMHSLEVQSGGRDIPLGVFDLGLTQEQRGWLAKRASVIIEPGWDLEVPEHVRAERPHARGLTVRPFLPRHFPGYDIYLWIDADVWLQDWRGVELYGLGAQRGCLTATPHSDRAYRVRSDVLSYRRHQLQIGYGKDLADRLFLQHHLNAGIFAAPSDSSVWDDWAVAYQEGIAASGGVMMSDQVALNVACFRHRQKLQMLPALCNWQCHLALPFWDPDAGRFCEPFLPHQPISMLHLTHETKGGAFDIRGLDGRRRQMRLRAPRRGAAA
ncbi:MAG: hypothetical protein RH942_08825 [Kiloniellaceae bacterium]